MGATKIDNPPPGPSRPLHTGVKYILVSSTRAHVVPSWDKLFYAPGDKATLTCESDKTATALAFSVETQTEPGGAWMSFLDVKGSASGKKTTGTLTFPKNPAPPLIGELISAKVNKAQAYPGDLLVVEFKTKGLDGAFNRVTIERESPTGVWETVTRWMGDIKGNVLKTDYQLPGSRGDEIKEIKQGKLLTAKFQDAELKPGETAWLTCTAENLGNEPIHFDLERQDIYGAWHPVGYGCSSASTGTAKVGISIPSDGLQPIKFGEARFEGTAEIGKPVSALAAVDGPDGSLVQMVLETEIDGEWVQVASLPGKVKGGEARASFNIPKPAPKAGVRNAILSAVWPESNLGEVTLQVDWAAATGAPGEYNPDGTDVQFTLEREVSPGVWEKVSESSTSVGKGSARVKLPLEVRPKVPPAPELLVTWPAQQGQSAAVRLHNSDQATQLALDRSVAMVILQTQAPGGAWIDVEKEEARFRGADANVSVSLPIQPVE